jgi:uncharacterized protein YcaQ
LQSDFKVLPIGVAKAGRWRYAFIYELAGRHYPELPDRARSIPEDEARVTLLKRYFYSVGAARQRDVAKLFGWPMSDIEAAVLKLCEEGIVLQDVWLEGESYAVLAELVV